jgi:hypothetical protein
MIGFLFLYFNLIWAQTPERWANALRIVEKHEFYTNNEVILKPKDSWQTLLGVISRDAQFGEVKDCVYYYVPGLDQGQLKIKSVPLTSVCEKFIFDKPDREWNNLRSLQFSFEYNYLTFFITHQDYSVEKWQVSLFEKYKNPSPRIFMSSAEHRSGTIIFLNSKTADLYQKLAKRKILKDGEICQIVDESCQVRGASTCSFCENGWYEIPTGCKVSPKFCGVQNCGAKHRPACRRGMIYQKTESEFNCRSNSSFAFCQRGLKIQCQGNLAYCI